MTEKQQPQQLIRTCSICGVQKPLSAFLQLGGHHGATYGNICSVCRGAQASKAVTKDDKSGATSPGSKIGKDARLQAELEKEQLAKKQKELTRKEILKRDKLVTDKIEKKESEAKSQKLHREKYLKTQQSFLSNFNPEKVSPSQKTTDSTFVSQINISEEKQRALESQQFNENLKNTIDTTNQFLPGQQPTIIEKEGRAFGDFLAWLGPDAPIRRVAEQYKKKSLSANPPLKESVKEIDASLENTAKKNWGPSSKR